MMEQLGIKSLRPGPSGNENAPNHANYDESKANPFPDLPDVLTIKDGKKVTTPEMWWNQRRPEIVEDFEREVLGRVPSERAEGDVDGHGHADGTAGTCATVGEAARRARGQRLLPGHQSRHPNDAGTPADAKGPVPVMMMFGGFGGFPGRRRPGAAGRPPGPRRRRRRTRPRRSPGAAESRAATRLPPQQLIAAGLGLRDDQPRQHPGRQRRGPDARASSACATRASRASPTTGARCGRGRGARRAGWTTWRPTRPSTPSTSASKASRATARRRSSRWRSTRASPSCSSARPARAAPSCTAATSARPSRTSPAPGEYHWMAGNFLKYGAAEASFGSKNAGDLPVDAHQLIALCARARRSSATASPSAATPSGSTSRAATWPPSPPARCSACSAPRTSATTRRLQDRKDAPRERGPARRPTRLAPARRRPHRRAQLEALHPLGRQDARTHAGGAVVRLRAGCHYAGRSLAWPPSGQNKFCRRSRARRAGAPASRSPAPEHARAELPDGRSCGEGGAGADLPCCASLAPKCPRKQPFTGTPAELVLPDSPRFIDRSTPGPGSAPTRRAGCGQWASRPSPARMR